MTSPALAPFWKKIGSQEGLLGTALQVTAGLGAAGTAAMLLKPFRVETVAPEHAGGLAAAAGQYGEEWTRGVIDGWFGSTHHFEADRDEWVERLPGLCAALRTAGARRRGGCCPPAPGAGSAISCGSGQPPRRPRSGSRGWRC